MSTSPIGATSPATGPDQNAALAALKAQVARVDSEIDKTKKDKSLDCKEQDGRLTQLRAQRARAQAQIDRLEHARRLPAGGAEEVERAPTATPVGFHVIA